jgi:hypothetical protein
MNGDQEPADKGDGRRFAAMLGFGLVFWCFYIGYGLHMDIAGNDFGVFHRAAGEPLGNVYALRETNPFAYPPTTLLWLKPWALLGPNMGFVLWSALSIGAIAWTSMRLMGLRAALLVVASPALATTVVVGQFGALVGAMVLFAVSLKGWRQGVLLGLAATVKPQILIAAPFVLLARRDWAALLGAGIAGISVVIAELLMLGPGLWLDWLKALQAFPKAVERAGAYAGSVSPAGVASQFHLPGWPFLAMGIVIAALLLGKRARVADRVELAGLIIIASALISPYLLVYDIVAMMPLAIQSLSTRAGRTRMSALAAYLNPFVGIGILWVTASLLKREGPASAQNPSGISTGPTTSQCRAMA